MSMWGWGFRFGTRDGDGNGNGASQANITRTLIMDPTLDSDTMYETDGDSDPIETAVDNESVVRWYPTTRPADLNYMRDSASTFPSWRNADNGINSNPVVRYSLAAHSHSSNGASFTMQDLIAAADACVFAISGRLDAVDTGGSDQFIMTSGNDPVEVYATEDGLVSVRFSMASAQLIDLEITPDGTGLFAGVFWFHDGVIDWWANGVKQTQQTSVNNFNSLAGTFLQVNGNTNVDWTLARLEFASSHVDEVDIADLAAFHESRLGR